MATPPALPPSAITTARNAVRRQMPRRPVPRAPVRVSRGYIFRRSLQLIRGVLGVRAGIAAGRRKHTGPEAELWQARQWRTFLEQMGGVYMKIGQILAVRMDLFSWEVCQEFAALLDRALPFPGEVAMGIIEAELKAPLGEIFSEFDPQPLAAASIGQVHMARLRLSGEKVAVKVRRPGVEHQVTADLKILLFLAAVLDTLRPGSGVKQLPIVQEVERIMDEELSYQHEMRSGYEFRKTLKGRKKRIYAPRVYPELCTDRVLVMEFVDGIQLSTLLKAIESQDQSTLERLEQQGIDRRKLAKRFQRSILEQLYEFEIVHGDPHPGNILIMKKNRLAFIDFGATVRFGPLFRMRMERISQAFGRLDADGAVNATLASWEPLPLKDVDGFKSALKPIYQRLFDNAGSKYGDPNLKSGGLMLGEVARLGAKHGILAPWEHLRYNRLIAELDTTVISLDPGFNLAKGFRRYFDSKAKRQMKVQLKPQRVQDTMGKLLTLVHTIPEVAGELQFQMAQTISRGNYLYVSSIGNAAYVGKVMLQHALVFSLGCAVTLVISVMFLGQDTVNGKLSEYTGLRWPWWLWGLLFLHLSVIFQRIRSRFSEIRHDKR